MSYSSTVGEADDHAAALMDQSGDILAQTPSAVPAFVAILGRTTRAMLGYFPVAALEPGDVLITNDPWICAGHLPDVNLLTPIFYRGKVVAFAANTAHLSDLGGRVSAESRDVFEEGLRIPPSKLYTAGRPNTDVFRFIQANSRSPKQIIGDLRAQLAANVTAEQRVVEMLGEYALDDLAGLSREIQTRTERAMRHIVGTLPDGDYHGAVTGDGYDEELRIVVTVRIRGTDVEVDYSGTSGQVDRAINCPFNLTYAESTFPFRCIAAHVPMAEGALRPIRVVAPLGSVLNPRFPAAVLRRTVAVHNAHAAIFQALSPLAPRYLPSTAIAAHSGCIYGFDFRGTWKGRARVYGRGLRLGEPRFSQGYIFMGGQGATLAADGHNALAMPDNCANVPVEVMENRAPVLVECKTLQVDSGGPGCTRGGLGQRVSVRVLADEPLTFVPYSLSRIGHPASGIKGGRCGGGGRLFDTETRESLHPRTNITVLPGHSVTVISPGGGGASDPFTRDAAVVATDVRLGYVTRDSARADYGVALTDAGEVDYALTRALRSHG